MSGILDYLYRVKRGGYVFYAFDEAKAEKDLNKAWGFAQQKKEVQHPGVRGGKFYRTKRGEIVYGNQSQGGKPKVEQPALPFGQKKSPSARPSPSGGEGEKEEVPPEQKYDIRIGHYVNYKTDKEIGWGTITAIGRKGCIVRDDKGKPHNIDFKHLRGRQMELHEYLKTVKSERSQGRLVLRKSA